MKNHTKKYQVVGMDCANCAIHVEDHVKKIKDIESVKVNFITGELELTSQKTIPDEIIQKAVKSAGYKIAKENAGVDNTKNIEHEQQKKYYKQQLMLTSISGSLIVLAILLKLISVFTIIVNPLLIAGILIGGYRIGIKGFKEALIFSAGMNLLMSIAVIGAIFLGEWTEAAMVIFLFSFAQLLEMRSIEKVKDSVAVMVKASPKIANVLNNGKWLQLSVEKVKVGQIILIKPGEKIPLDGRVIKGETHADQSIITGESLPVKLSAGDRVYAGSINQSGVIQVEVDKPFSESTISNIVHLVSEAQASKAPQQTFVEKFARYYTPAVIIIAIFVAIIPPFAFSLSFFDWFYRALVLLVIACPCALVISTPVTIVSGLTNAMKNGILIKGGIYLEKFSKLKSLVFDKTGTLTIGKPQVQSIFSANGYSEDEILRIAASIETHSEHPLAHAILQKSETKNISLAKITNFRLFKGRGVQSELNEKKYFVGSHRHFEEKGICDDISHQYFEQINLENMTPVFVGSDQEIIGIISISDTIRNEAADTIDLLKKKGIKKIGLLTGDNKGSAERVANKLNIDYYKSELLPEEKLLHIKELRDRYLDIGMVGDGINDAPALAESTIGIAMGMQGSDIVLETADITLLKDDLLKLPYLHTLSRKTVKIIKENITIALGLKLIFFVLAIPGLATLWMAVFADMGASLIVIFNGLRVLQSK